MTILVILVLNCLTTFIVFFAYVLYSYINLNKVWEDFMFKVDVYFYELWINWNWIVNIKSSKPISFSINETGFWRSKVNTYTHSIHLLIRDKIIHGTLSLNSSFLSFNLILHFYILLFLYEHWKKCILIRHWCFYYVFFVLIILYYVYLLHSNTFQFLAFFSINSCIFTYFPLFLLRKDLFKVVF